jgi:hypothetical protein
MVLHHAKSGDEYLCIQTHELLLFAGESTIFIIFLILSWNKQKRLLNIKKQWFVVYEKLFWGFFFGISESDTFKKAPEVLF